MNHRYTLSLAWMTTCVVILPTRLPAEDYRYHQFRSGTNELTWEVSFRNTSEGPTVDDLIWFQFSSATNSQPFRIYLPEDSALCEIKLIHEDGKSAEKSSMGRRYGSDFTETNVTKMKISIDRGGSLVSTIVVPDGSGKFSLPSCSELFRATSSNDCTLKIQMQVIRERVKDRVFLGTELVRFPELTVRIRKADAASPP